MAWLRHCTILRLRGYSSELRGFDLEGDFAEDAAGGGGGAEEGEFEGVVRLQQGGDVDFEGIG